MTCDVCGVDAHSIWGLKDTNYCKDCWFGRTPDPSSPHFIQKAGNPYKPWLTKAGNDVLSNRVESRDGNIIDRRTGRDSPFVTKD